VLLLWRCCEGLKWCCHARAVRCGAVKALLGLSQQKGGYDMFVCFLLVCFDLVGKGGVFHKGRCCGIYCWNLVAFLRLYNFSFCHFFIFFLHWLFSLLLERVWRSDGGAIACTLCAFLFCGIADAVESYDWLPLKRYTQLCPIFLGSRYHDSMGILFPVFPAHSQMLKVVRVIHYELCRNCWMWAGQHASPVNLF
jgi:hypothetical protein